MFQLINKFTKQVVQVSEDKNEFRTADLRDHITIKLDTPFESKVSKPPLVTIQEPKDWDFSTLSDAYKKSLVAKWMQKDYEGCKDILNKNKIASLCCTSHSKLIDTKIKAAIENGSLTLGS